MSQALDQTLAATRVWATKGAQAKNGSPEDAEFLLDVMEETRSEAKRLGEADEDHWKAIRQHLHIVLENARLKSFRCVTNPQGGLGDRLDEPAAKGVPGAGNIQHQPRGVQQPDTELAGARPVEGSQKIAGKAVPVAARKSRNKCG